MINLLPPDVKEAYRYARHNRALMKWINATAFGILGALLLTAGGVIYLNRSISDYTAQIAATNQSLHTQNLPAVQKQVTDISNNLKLVVKVLSKEILFSKLLDQLGTAIPKNAVLTDLSITQAQTGIDITAATTNYAAATQLQVNLADPRNQIFSKADIVSINCESDPTKVYPCTVTLRALFAANNPFLFISNAGVGVKK